MGKKPAISADSLQQKLKQIDTYQVNHSYLEEKHAFRLVQSGDVDAVRAYLKNGLLPSPTPVKDRKKNMEYMLIITIGVVSRVAIEAGVPAPEAFLYSDTFLARISECTTEEELLPIYEQVALTYTALVKQHREQNSGNYLVLRSRKYIYDHLFEPLSLSVLAGRMGVSSEHLARCFKAETGLSVSQYIVREKVNLAADLLAYSNRSVNDIASYLQFKSTSYFIKLFKREMQMTPTEYRKAHVR